MVRPATIDRLTILLGTALLVYGVSLIHVPAALILAGGLLILSGFGRKA